jgi:hypothetical protein
MHRCVISTMFGWCFWFLKKTFLFKQPLVPPAALVLRISHSGYLPRRAPPPGPSHFPLRFFNPSIPPRPVLHISHSGSLTRWSPPPGPSHFPLRFFNPSIPPARSSESAATVLPTALSLREHKTPFPSPVTDWQTVQTKSKKARPRFSKFVSLSGTVEHKNHTLFTRIQNIPSQTNWQTYWINI